MIKSLALAILLIPSLLFGGQGMGPGPGGKTYTGTTSGYTDNFDTSNNPLPSPWTTVTSMVAVKAVGGLAECVAEGNCAAYYNNTTANNQYSQIKLVAFSGVSQGPIVRVSPSATSFYTVRQNSSSALWLAKRVSGAWTELETISQSTATGDILRLEASGTSLIVKVNGVTVHTETGQSDLTAGFAGLELGNINTGVNEWAGGDL